MTDFDALDIFLHNELVGTLTHLPGDRNLFTFSEEYLNNISRATLSLSFIDRLGDLIINQKIIRTRLPPFFANLLPEGHMREYLASQAKVNSQREFYLLSALGKDLPGSLTVRSKRHKGEHLGGLETSNDEIPIGDESGVLRFSLAGVQLKFSAIWESEKGLTIPVDGIGGGWIVKLPSSVYEGVAENEYTMMELARKIGIDVPETALISIDQIHGLPRGINTISNQAFTIKRFDRDSSGQGIHIEDFAQVFGVFPEKKYKAASYRNIAEVIWAETGEKGIEEFIRRFVFNALIGNGDMHLKNWSLIYPNKVNAALAPAYDFVSTIPYIAGDELALTFVDSKAFNSLDYEQFRRFAAKSQLPESLVLDGVRETVRAFKLIWKSVDEFHLSEKIVSIIDSHLKTIPIYNDFSLTKSSVRTNRESDGSM